MTRSIFLAGNTAWGMYNFRIGLIRYLLSLGYEVHVVVPADEFVERLQDAGCQVHFIRIDSKGKNPLVDLYSLMQFRRLYRAHRPSLVINYTIKPIIYGALAASAHRIPFISVFTGLGSAFSSRNLVRYIVELLCKRSQRAASAVYFLNKEDRENAVHRGLVPRNVVRSLPGEGIDLSHFAVTAAVGTGSEGTPQAGAESEPSSTTFLFAGRLLWEKGVGDYVDAARRVKNILPGTRFLLLGPCDVDNASAVSREQVRGWEASGDIIYLGASADVRPHLLSATCIVLPSYYREGVPRILMEAACLERPIITTDMPGCRDVVEDGVSGFLTPPRNVAVLADTCLKLASMPAEELRRMGRAGRRKMEREFDERLVFAAYVEAINEALSPETGPTKLPAH